jgi:hypothetical protein
MISRRRIIGTTNLKLTCNKQVLIDIIEDYIEKNENSFSFKELYNYIKHIANENNYFDKEPNTEYSQIELLSVDVQTVNLIIWEKIWNKTLIIDFYKNLYRQYPEEFYFIKVRESRD